MKEKQGGKVFLIVSILLFLLWGVVTVYTGFQPSSDHSIWFPLILLGTNVIYVFINIKEGRRYYTIGFSVMAVSVLIYILIPYLL
ncbi:hypothetical protein NQ095_15195 [Rossellomorea sp. SC111]|uniref:hypothetical protein n=1 Tax=Rossellomorea sp. SC111 TaxID=2968985 RepID=UPI00215B50F3|nr:hypothetical protein [Rossellomorea sp. SC111]MCR8849763.1 hypothetical protein [Rossellomorea sp. SC111]